MRTTLTTLATTAVSFAVLATGSVMVQAAMPAPAHASVADSTATDWQPCEYEDGSSQDVCVWDASHSGNGVGDSFVAIDGGTDAARYIYVSHREAHALLNG